MLFLFSKSDDFTGTYVLLSKSVDKSPAKYERVVMLYDSKHGDFTTLD